MLEGAAVLAVGCALFLFAGFFTAVFRAFFSRTPSRARFRMAMLRSALLVFGTCGNWLVVSMFGVGVSAAFGGVIVCAAVVLSCVLSRFWEARDVLAAVSCLQMSGAAAGGDGFSVRTREARALCGLEIVSQPRKMLGAKRTRKRLPMRAPTVLRVLRRFAR